jgi:hypothetical protein
VYVPCILRSDLRETRRISPDSGTSTALGSPNCDRFPPILPALPRPTFGWLPDNNTENDRSYLKILEERSHHTSALRLDGGGANPSPVLALRIDCQRSSSRTPMRDVSAALRLRHVVVPPRGLEHDARRRLLLVPAGLGPDVAAWRRRMGWDVAETAP